LRAAAGGRQDPAGGRVRAGLPAPARGPPAGDPDPPAQDRREGTASRDRAARARRGTGLSDVGTAVAAAVPGGVVQEVEHRGELTLVVPRERLVEVARSLAGPPLAFVLLADLSCADFPDEPGRFRLAYQLASLESGARLRPRVWAGAEPEVDSVTGVWPTANWH